MTHFPNDFNMEKEMITCICEYLRTGCESINGSGTFRGDPHVWNGHFRKMSVPHVWNGVLEP